MNAKVTIGLCIKNSEKTIKDSISSIITQKYPSKLVQVIIVDGCSKDKTMNIVASVIARSNVKTEIYSDKGKGLGSARQMVVTKANSEYIIFVDGDATLFDDFVTEQVNFMENNPNVGIAFGRPLLQEGTLVSTITALFNYSVECSRGTTATIFRAETIKQVGGFDQDNTGAAEDVDIIARIEAKGWLASVNSKARFYHNYRESFKEFWREQEWMGYGSHYVSHKNKEVEPPWRSLPFWYIVYTVKNANKSYKMTHRKISFLIPLQMVLGNISWWSGFVKSHIYGYGHRAD